MTHKNSFASKLRHRRDSREFERALRSASPSMHVELIAAAARQSPFSR